jgi:hypothetical protein
VDLVERIAKRPLADAGDVGQLADADRFADAISKNPGYAVDEQLSMFGGGHRSLAMWL